MFSSRREKFSKTSAKLCIPKSAHGWRLSQGSQAGMVEENEHGARLVPAEAPGARRDEGDGELDPDRIPLGPHINQRSCGTAALHNYFGVRAVKTSESEQTTQRKAWQGHADAAAGAPTAWSGTSSPAGLCEPARLVSSAEHPPETRGRDPSEGRSERASSPAEHASWPSPDGCRAAARPTSAGRARGDGGTCQ